MEFRDRIEQLRKTAESPAGGGDSSAGLDGLRQEGRDLLAAADDAIRNALSGDSVEFLNAVRQTGGQ